MIKFKNSKFILEIDGVIKAQATLIWFKIKINNKKIRQPYITDVESHEIGCGTILMNGIIDFFKNKKSNRAGYNSNQIHLEVNPTNFRAIKLYEKVGFEFNNQSYESFYENHLLQMIIQIN